MREIIIDGKKIKTVGHLTYLISEKLDPGAVLPSGDAWWEDMDRLRSVLGGLNNACLDKGCIIYWNNFEESRKSMGYEYTFQWYSGREDEEAMVRKKNAAIEIGSTIIIDVVAAILEQAALILKIQ